MRKLTVLAGGVLLAFATSVWAQGEAAKAPGSLEGYVPSDPILYVHWLGFTKGAATFRDTELLKLIREPDVQAFGAELSRFMDALIREKGGNDSVVEWPDVRLLMDSELAYALLDVRGRVPGMALIVRAGDRTADLARLVDRLLDKATEGKAKDIPEEPLDGVTYKSVGPLCVAWSGGDLILTSGKETMRRVARAAKGNDNSIVKNDRYAAAAKRFGAEREFITAWFDVERLRDQTGEMDHADRFEKVWELTGLKDVNYVRLALGAEPPGVKGTLYIHAPQGASGLLKLLPTTPVDEKAMLAGVDEKAPDVAIARLNAAAIYDVIVEVSTAVGNPERVNAGIDRMNEALGFDLRKDLLAALGDEVMFRTVGSGLQFSATVNVKDEKAVAAALEKVPAAINGEGRPGGKQVDDHINKGRPTVEVDKFDYKGFNCIAIKIVATPFPVTPSYAFVGGKLVIASTPQTLKTAIDLAGAQPAKLLTASAAYQAVRSHVAAKPSMLAYDETTQGFAAAYAGVITPLVQMLNAAKDSIPANSLATKFPRVEAITPHLFASVTAMSRDGEGYLFESYGPAASMTSGVAGAGIVMGFTLPALAKAQEAARRASCFNNIRQIGIAMFQYAADHDDKFPKTLGELMHAGYLTTPRVFVCPSDSRPFKFEIKVNGAAPADPMDFKHFAVADLDRAIDPICSYVKVPGLNHDADANAMILYEKDGAHNGEGRNCMFNDGRVQWLPEAEFRRLLAEQQKK